MHIGVWRGLAQFSISKFNFMKKNITLDTKEQFKVYQLYRFEFSCQIKNTMRLKNHICLKAYSDPTKVSLDFTLSTLISCPSKILLFLSLISPTLNMKEQHSTLYFKRNRSLAPTLKHPSHCFKHQPSNAKRNKNRSP